jgi:hypothetical protein
VAVAVTTKVVEDERSSTKEAANGGCTAAAERVQLDLGNASDSYATWPHPTVIIVDGPYGVDGFDGDLHAPTGLAEWYAPHVAAWARYATAETTLWFWNTEIGWATVHPVLALHGWSYRACHIWDKGIAHIAGNVNSKTIRRFPVVTEVCVQYVRNVEIPTVEGTGLPIQQWLRYEWGRTGLPFSKTNEACGVKNAATRKYFTADHLWYFPPPEMMERLAHYANVHGKPTAWPYFSLDGRILLTAEQWARMRPKWHHEHGITNVWSERAVRGAERIKDAYAAVHGNQKPVSLLRRIICASSDADDVVWEPFGGLCSVAVAAMQTARRCYSAEINPDYHRLALERIARERMIDALFADA